MICKNSLRILFLCYNYGGDFMKRVELLSPVGNMESLHQAVMNGADAVYLGGKKFGARKFASNFDNDEMVEAIKFCHLYGVRIFVTVNTMIFEEEFDEVLDYVDFLHKNNVDAIIVQDIGLVSIVRKMFPNLEIHMSTQAHNNNSYGVEYLKKLGATRVVLARELSLEEIKKIDVYIEKEVFVHGALCVSYSGCCLFSSMNGGRSGNRGECVGSCRLPYKLCKNDKVIKTDGDYLLSTKSLCTIDKVPELIENGITSFKIEGRMKSPEYVGYVTRIYRNKIDEYYDKKKISVRDDEIDNLKKLYNRELTHGYLFNESGKALMNIKTSNHIGVRLGKVIEIDKKKIKIKLYDDLNQEDGIRFDNDAGMIVNKLYNSKGLLVNSLKKGDIALVDNKVSITNANYVRKTIDNVLNKDLKILPKKKIGISILCIAKIGSPLKIVISDFFHTLKCTGSVVEVAKNSPIELDRIKIQLEKLGNTMFNSVDTRIEMDDNIFISIKEINDLRRQLIDELIEKRKNYRNKEYIKNDYPFIKSDLSKQKLNINVLVRNEEQLKTCISNKVNYIYTDNYSLYKKYKDKASIFYKTSRVSNNFIDLKDGNVLATEIGAIYKYSNNNKVVSDYFLNVANVNSVNLLRDSKVKLVCLSVENSFDTIREIALVNNNVEVIVYGRVELMVTKYCPLKMLINNDESKCSICNTKDKYSFKDQYGNLYPIVSEKHFMHLMHYKNINLIKSISELKNFGVYNFRLELFDENASDINRLIKEVRNEYE